MPATDSNTKIQNHNKTINRITNATYFTQKQVAFLGIAAKSQEPQRLLKSVF